MGIDFDKSGRSYQRSKVSLGPSLGTAWEEVTPATKVLFPGTYTVAPGDSFLLVAATGAVTIQLPDVTKWVAQPSYQPGTAFDRSITVKDWGGLAGTYNITIQPFDSQKIDQSATATLTVGGQTARLVPLNDLTGWVLETSIAGGAGPQGPQGIPGPIGPPGVSGAVVDWISVKDHGAIGDGFTDDTAAIQAAIDYACNTGVSTIYLPSGRYKVSSTLYLDLPTNLRTPPVNVTKQIGFTLCLVGDYTCGSETGGAVILCTFNNNPGLIVGPGQGMMLKHFSIFGPNTGQYRAQMPFTGSMGVTPCGVAFVGGGGASRFWCESVLTANFYGGFITGTFGDGLNDSGTFIKCDVASNAAVGIWIAQTQNFIMSVHECNIDATIGLINTNVVGVKVHGGNWSSHSLHDGSLPISSISAWSKTPFGNTFLYSFTATIVNDGFVTYPNLVYSCFTFETANFGIVPCEIIGLSGSTITLQVYNPWTESMFGTIDITAAAGNCTVETEVRAATKVYASEVVTTFKGKSLLIDGIHIENNFAPTTFIDCNSTFGSNFGNKCANIFFNTDSSKEDYLPVSGMTDQQKAQYYAAHSFPFLKINNCTLQITDSDMGINTNLTPDPVWVDIGAGLFIERVHNLNFNVRLAGGGGGGDNFQVASNDGSRATNFLDGMTSAGPVGDWFPSERQTRFGQYVSPFDGYKPSMWTTPCVPPSMLAQWQTPGAITVANGPPYTLPWGGQIYRFYEQPTTGVLAHYHVISNHTGYTYGQDLTTTNIPGLSWSYHGQSPIIKLDASTMKFMRQGLGIIINNGDGSGDRTYYVKAVFPGLGYIQVAQSLNFSGVPVGDKNTTFTGTSIKQQPFALTLLP